jgi:hypothetical protein
LDDLHLNKELYNEIISALLKKGMAWKFFFPAGKEYIIILLWIYDFMIK